MPKINIAPQWISMIDPANDNFEFECIEILIDNMQAVLIPTDVIGPREAKRIANIIKQALDKEL